MDLHSATIMTYRAVGIASDRLPYSAGIDVLRDHLRALGHEIDRHTLWGVVRDLRKRDKRWPDDQRLPHIGRGPNNRMPLPPADVLFRNAAMLDTEIDDLPYTDDMDRLVRLVREATSIRYTHWQVWWGLLAARKGAANRR